MGVRGARATPRRAGDEPGVRGRGVAGVARGGTRGSGVQGMGGGGRREGGEPERPLRSAYCCFLGPENGETLPGAGMRCPPGAPRAARCRALGARLAPCSPGRRGASSSWANRGGAVGALRRWFKGDRGTVSKQSASNFSIFACSPLPLLQ